MMSDEFPKETLSLCRFAIAIVILIVIECVNVNDASYSAWGQCNREMPIPCDENGVDEARDKARDKENSHANPGSTRFWPFRVLRVIFSMMALSPSFVVNFVASFVDSKSSS